MYVKKIYNPRPILTITFHLGTIFERSIICNLYCLQSSKYENSYTNNVKLNFLNYDCISKLTKKNDLKNTSNISSIIYYNTVIYIIVNSFINYLFRYFCDFKKFGCFSNYNSYSVTFHNNMF